MIPVVVSPNEIGREASHCFSNGFLTGKASQPENHGQKEEHLQEPWGRREPGEPKARGRPAGLQCRE